jgi:hypothetical protein
VVEASRATDSQVTGTWFDPVTAGQGLQLVRLASEAGLGGLLAGGWFTHDPRPTSQPPQHSPHWFTVLGGDAAADGSLHATVYQTLGGHLGGVRTHNNTAIGELTLRPLSCQRMDLSYAFVNTELAGEFRGKTGSIALQRLSGSCAIAVVDPDA